MLSWAGHGGARAKVLRTLSWVGLGGARAKVLRTLSWVGLGGARARCCARCASRESVYYGMGCAEGHRPYAGCVRVSLTY
jgi:hypothetical protein